VEYLFFYPEAAIAGRHSNASLGDISILVLKIAG
jgi:hypothetical protein